MTKRRQKSSERLVPRNQNDEEKRSFRNAVKKSRTSGTSIDSEENPFTDNEDSTTSILKRDRKTKTNFIPGSPEEVAAIPISQAVNQNSLQLGWKIITSVLTILGTLIAVIYFFTEIFSKNAVNENKIENIEKRQEDFKSDVNENINRVENRLEKRIDGIEVKIDKKNER